jgi:hypothetical protein
MSMNGRYLPLSSEQLNALLADPQSVDAFVYPDPEGFRRDELDLDRSWHLIHYLLNAETWGGTGSLSDAVLGGTALDGTDAGYGPYRYLLPSSVAATSAALSEVSPEELWDRFDPASVAIAEVYPQGWTGGHIEREYTLNHYKALQSFFSKAAASGNAILLYLC